MCDVSKAFTSQTNVSFAFKTQIEICLKIKRKKHPAFRVLNAFYFQTDFNLRFKRKIANAKIYEDKHDLYCTPVSLSRGLAYSPGTNSGGKSPANDRSSLTSSGL